MISLWAYDKKDWPEKCRGLEKHSQQSQHASTQAGKQACSVRFPEYEPEHMIESSLHETKSVFPIKNKFLGYGW